VTEPSPELPTAEQFWAMEDAFVIGRAFYDRIPPHRFPAWASRILRIVWSRCLYAPPDLEPLVRLLQETQDWPRAKAIFRDLRAGTLQMEAVVDPTRDQKIQLAVCNLAETIAKAAYNRSNPPDPFPDDAGHWIAGCVREVVRHIDEEKFRKLAWSGLVN
jgi:hypothetical protein